MDSTPNTCTVIVWQERPRSRREREQSGDQKQPQWTGNGSWLMCAAVLGCSHLLLIVDIEITHACSAMQGLPHNAVLRLVLV